MKQILKFLVVIIFFVLIGVFVPILLIDDNLDSFKGEDKRYAIYALNHTRWAHDDSVEQFLTMRLRVQEIRKISNNPRQCGYDPGREGDSGKIYGDYRAILRGYTFFGIPLYTYTISCTNSSRYN
ncbi:hypothetical protein HY407_04520 [Candidatus Gottesmanbacteria bacterium]|nr:hypothetical protein [Candidatus Gottesmanbacteria bacterium]